jgi:hypothetical protein
VPWYARPTKKNDEAKEETNFHQPFFFGGRIFFTWQSKNPSEFRPKDFCEKNAPKSQAWEEFVL